MSNSHFDFQQFHIDQDRCAMKVGTDGVLLGAWAAIGAGATPNVLDVGTGTGIVALMMAQRFDNANVTAIDIDASSAEQAQGNAAASPFTSRIKVENVALQSLPSGQLYNAIVCNPPFFYHSLTCPDPQRTTARHAISLTACDIAHHSARLLAPNGQLSVILPYEQHGLMEAEASFVGLFLCRRCTVRTSERKPPSRILLAFTDTPCATLDDTAITIGDDTHQRLTKDFYL